MDPTKSTLRNLLTAKVIAGAAIVICAVIVCIAVIKSSGSKSDPAFDLFTMMVTQREKVAKLTTLKFTEDMLLAVTDSKQDTVALILAHPYLKLGFDLKDLRQEDVFERNDTVFIHFPPAIVTHCGCNPQDRELIFDNTGRKTDWDAEIKKKMAEAEERIKASAAKQHLYERAANNAVELMCKLFSFGGRNTVCVIVDPAGLSIPAADAE